MATYTHKLNKNAFKKLELNYSYDLKRHYIADYKIVLNNYNYLRYSRALQSVKNKIEYIKQINPHEGRNEQIRVLLCLEAFSAEKKNILNSSYANHKKELKELFYKYFEITGGSYFKTITLKPVETIQN